MKNSMMSNANKEKHRPLNRKLRFWIIIFLIVIAICLIRWYYQNWANKKPESPPVSVVSANVTTKDMPIYLEGLGTVTSYYSVTVKTQINGLLMDVFFKEGQFVKKGEHIAQIDPRPYEAAIIQYQGQLQRDQALLVNAKLDLKRYQTLWRQNSVSKQTLDTQVSLVQQDEGTVKIDEGLIASTKLNLIYCRITSPMNGIIGLRLVDPGNYVQVSDTGGLVVITMTQPITVVFTLPEDNIPSVLEKTRAGKTLPTFVYDRTQHALLDEGVLLAMDSEVDTSTGTVKLKSEFKNAQNHLYPNQFVNVKLLLDMLKNAVVVPTAAIQHGSKGNYVYVIHPDATVHLQTVVTGPVNGDITTILAGLKQGQQVVVEGVDKLTDGAKVAVAPNTIASKRPATA